jgi:rare lipoprotein A
MRRSALKISWACALLASGGAACSPDYPAQSPSVSAPRPAEAERPGAWTPPPANDYAYSPPDAEPAPGPENPSGKALAVFSGQASYYGDSLAGNRTASGERYDPRAFTAAHKTLSFGTVVRVVRPDTGAWVNVRITDRGPFVARRVVEVRAEVVSYGASKSNGKKHGKRKY